MRRRINSKIQDIRRDTRSQITMHHSMLRRPIMAMPNRVTTHKLDRTIVDRTADMVSVINSFIIFLFAKEVTIKSYNKGWKLV